MATFRYEIDRSGNFNPDATQDLPRGTDVAFVLAEGVTWSTVYVFSGSPLAPDSNLFGATAVRTSTGGTIQTTAVLNTTYTLSVFEGGAGLEESTGGIKNGTIKVGGG